MLEAMTLQVFPEHELLRSMVVEETTKALLHDYGSMHILDATRRYIRSLTGTSYPVFYNQNNGNCSHEHSSVICYFDGEVIKIKEGRKLGKTLREYGNLEIIHYVVKPYGFILTPSPTSIYHMPREDRNAGVGMSKLNGVTLNVALSSKRARKDVARKLGMLMGVFNREGIIHGDLKPSHIYYEDGRIGVIDVEGSVIVSTDYVGKMEKWGKVVDEKTAARGMISSCYQHAEHIGNELLGEFDSGFESV